MRFRGILLGLAVAATLSATGGKAFAQAANNPTITVDENGNGSLVFPGGAPFNVPGVLAADPGPGGLALALTYNLLGPPGLVAGDLILLEPGGGGLISDIIRFNPAGTAPGYAASLVFYSDNLDGADALADRGFPTALYGNNITFTEVGPEVGPNGFTYTPTANQPGFIPGFGVTYVIRSDLAPAIPEPSSLALCGVMGTLGAAGAAWKRRKRTAPTTAA